MERPPSQETTASDSQDEDTSHEMSEMFDRTVLEETQAVLKNRFPQVVIGYLEDCEAYIDAMERALAEGNVSMFARNAHPLKASSAALGVLRMEKIARAAEHAGRMAAKDNQDKPNYGEQMCVSLRQAYAEVRPLMMELIKTG